MNLVRLGVMFLVVSFTPTSDETCEQRLADDGCNMCRCCKNGSLDDLETELCLCEARFCVPEPKPLPKGYRAMIPLKWDCTWTPHTPRPEDPRELYIDLGGWDCEIRPPAEECLCGNNVCMCKE